MSSLAASLYLVCYCFPYYYYSSSSPPSSLPPLPFLLILILLLLLLFLSLFYSRSQIRVPTCELVYRSPLRGKRNNLTSLVINMHSGLSDDVTREYGKVITTSSGCTFDSCFGNKPAAAEQPMIPHRPQRGEAGCKWRILVF